MLRVKGFKPTIRGGGAFKTPPEQNSCFWHLFVIQMTQKIWLSPNIIDNASHTLSGSQNDLKMGFYSIFVIGGTKIWIWKCSILAYDHNWHPKPKTNCY